MIILGIECTAHTFGVGIVKDGKVVSNEKSLFTTEKGGMIPAKVADYHVEKFPEVLRKAVMDSKIKLKDVDYIAYSQSPGIGHSLRVGAIVARTMSLQLNKPLIGVNHCIAHLEIGRALSSFKDPLLLYASGANTQLIGFEAGRYRIFGETLDIGIGNFLDSLARTLGIGFPGGPKIEELAKKGGYKELPYVVKGMDVVLGGILTYCKEMNKKGVSKEDICFSVQETVFAMLTEVTERALAHTGKNELVVGGGVGCNKRLQEMLKKMCLERGVKFYSPENEFLVDNAAMIALTGYYMKDSFNEDYEKNGRINPYLRTDEVEIRYR